MGLSEESVLSAKADLSTCYYSLHCVDEESRSESSYLSQVSTLEAKNQEDKARVLWLQNPSNGGKG
jgi:hypothetical protein